jgi:hypothetical protein
MSLSMGMWIRVSSLAVCLTANLASAWASDTGLNRVERRELRAGEVVERPMSFEEGEGSFVGGVSYQLVNAEPAVVLAELSTVDNLPHMLPFTLAAEVVQRSSQATFVELTQGKAPFVGRYTVQLVREGDQLSFWLDRDRPSNVDDLWGYFRVRPFDDGKTLLTVAIALDLGPGVTRWLFEDKIQRVVLSTPQKIRHFVEHRIVSGREAFAVR